MITASTLSHYIRSHIIIKLRICGALSDLSIAKLCFFARFFGVFLLREFSFLIHTMHIPYHDHIQNTRNTEQKEAGEQAPKPQYDLDGFLLDTKHLSYYRERFIHFTAIIAHHDLTHQSGLRSPHKVDKMARALGIKLQPAFR